MKELLDSHRARLLGELEQAEAERRALKAKGNEVGAHIGRIQTQLSLLNTMGEELSEKDQARASQIEGELAQNKQERARIEKHLLALSSMQAVVTAHDAYLKAWGLLDLRNLMPIAPTLTPFFSPIGGAFSSMGAALQGHACDVREVAAMLDAMAEKWGEGDAGNLASVTPPIPTPPHLQGLNRTLSNAATQVAVDETLAALQV